MLWDVTRKNFLHLSAFLFHASPVLGFKFWVLSYKLLLCDLLVFCVLYWFSRTRSLDASHVLRPDPHKPSSAGRLLWREEGKCFFFEHLFSPLSGLVCKNNQNPPLWIHIGPLHVLCVWWVMVGLMDVVSLVGIVSVFTCGGYGRSI